MARPGLYASAMTFKFKFVARDDKMSMHDRGLKLGPIDGELIELSSMSARHAWAAPSVTKLTCRHSGLQPDSEAGPGPRPGPG